MPRQIDVNEAFNLIEDVYDRFGWKPNGASTREQRNQWLESAVAVVHYGHAQLNPRGGDPRWCIKNAGGGRPQSDDVIVLSPTREYWDIIGSSGADNWGFSLSGHSSPLPAEQNVYAPSEAALPGGVTPGPGPDPEPEPEPEPNPDPQPPPHNDAAFVAINAKLDRILVMLEEAKDQQAADTKTLGRWMVEQAEGVVNSVVGQLSPRIDGACRSPLRRGEAAAVDPEGVAPTEG